MQLGDTYHWHGRERVQVGLKERVGRRRGRDGRGLDLGRSVVTEDGRVNAIGEAKRTHVRERTDPVVVNILVRLKHERVTLGSEDLNAVDLQGLGVDSVRLDDSHRVVVNAERVVRVARKRHEAEAVPEVIRFRQALA